jgi:predicted secreted Zn-dependent protease
MSSAIWEVFATHGGDMKQYNYLITPGVHIYFIRRCLFLVISITAALAPLVSICAYAEVITQIEPPVITYYDIRGQTVTALKKEILTYGPRDERGVQRTARASWHIRWERDRGEAKMSPIRIRLTSEILMPRCVTCEEADTSIRNEWNRYIALVLSHEQSHIAQANSGVIELKELIDREEKMFGRSLTDPRLEQLGQQVLLKMRERDARYDRETDNGRTEGIRLREQ